MGFTQRPTLTPPIGERDHFMGSRSARIALVEYGDYQCPYCGEAYPIVSQILLTMREQLCFVYRHFPLTAMHPHAMQAAEAAECAGSQGKFWQMHSVLYGNQRRLEYQDLLENARLVGLDLDRFQREMANHSHVPRIDEDSRSAQFSGVPGTPTFFVNGMLYQGGYDLQSLLTALRSAR